MTLYKLNLLPILYAITAAKSEFEVSFALSGQGFELFIPSSIAYPANTPRECHFRAWWHLSGKSTWKSNVQQTLKQRSIYSFKK